MIAADRAIKNQIYKVLVIQIALAVVFSLCAYVWKEATVFSAIVGCLAALVPSAYFLLRMSRQSEDSNAQQWLSFAYRTEFVKWLMTGMIFMLAFTSNHEWQPIVLFAGYILVLMSSWFVPLVIKGN